MSYSGWTVTAIYEDAKGKRYASQGDWLVMTRRGDLAQGHRFRTEAEAREFASPLQDAYRDWERQQAHEGEVLRTASSGLYRAACACGWWSRAYRDYGKADGARTAHRARPRKVKR